MKKILYLTIMLLFAAAAGSCSDNDDQLINPVGLPTAAQTFISQFFPNVDIIKVEKDGSHSKTDYSVKFANGYEVEFDALGEWTDVDAPKGRVIPAGIAPAPITQYIENYFLSDGINEISRDYRGYEVELVSGVGLTFSPDGQLIDID